MRTLASIPVLWRWRTSYEQKDARSSTPARETSGFPPPRERRTGLRQSEVVDTNNLIQTILVYAIPVLFAITLHEAAHGYVARRLGDSTAYMLGRVSLNPIRHIDPIGTIAM